MRAAPDLLSTAAAAREAGAEPAIVTAGETLSWAQVAGRVAAVVAELESRQRERALDLVRVPAVAFTGDTCLETVIVILAAIEAGVPMLLLHPRAAAAERGALLGLYEVPLLEPAELLDAAEGGGGAAPRIERERLDAARCLAVVRTSGSMGGPKGVVLSRRAMLAAAAASAANLDWLPDDRWLLQMPTAHVAGLSIVVRCLVARRAMVLAPMGLDVGELVGTIEHQRVTLLSLVPTTLHRLVDAGMAAPASLRAVLVGGAAAPRPLLTASREAGWPVLATYGLSETCGQLTTQSSERISSPDIEDIDLDEGGTTFGDSGCGPPLPGVSLRIVGAAGREGPIEVAGEMLMDGYLPTGDTWPFTADGWLRTGDVGRVDRAGNLHVLGRADEVIISGGENVHPLEVEEALLAHPAVGAACVFGVADDEWGQLVAAAMVADAAVADEPEPTAADLRAFLEPRLATHRRPRRIAWLDALPQTASGKPDRRATAELASGRLVDLWLLDT